MENAGYIALSRQMALKRELSVIANNIANMNTPAYKAERMVFREFIQNPESKNSVSFVQDFGMARNMTEGPVTSTGNSLDLAITGRAYFSLETPEGIRYTRHGRFQLDEQGQLINSQGSPVLSGDGAPIAIPPGSGLLTIAADGTMTGNGGVIGRIGLVEFENEKNLKRNANGLYVAANEQPQAATQSKMLQGMLEQSNVQAILEMTRMIDVHRSYQATQKLITTEHDQAMRAINKLMRMRQG